MGLLTFALNVTLDGCCDHREGIADDELHDYFTQLMDAAGAMLWGRVTYELMESAWPAVARDENAPRAMREWARKLEAKPKYVVSASRRDFPWNNTFRVEGDLREAVTQLKEKTPRGVLVGSPTLSAALERLGLIDEYRLVVHPVIAGHGPTLFQGLERSRRLELVSTKRLKSGVMALHYRRKEGGRNHGRAAMTRRRRHLRDEPSGCRRHHEVGPVARGWSATAASRGSVRSAKADLKRFGDEAPPAGEILAVRVESLDAKEALLEIGPPGFFTIPHFQGSPGLADRAAEGARAGRPCRNRGRPRGDGGSGPPRKRGTRNKASESTAPAACAAGQTSVG